MEKKSASENLTQNKFVTLSNTKTRNSYQKTLADGGGTWPPYRRACLSVESKQAPIRGVSSHGNVIGKYESHYEFIMAKKLVLSLHVSDKKQNHVPSYLALLLQCHEATK